MMEIRIRQIEDGWTYAIYQNNVIIGYKEDYYAAHPGEAFESALDHLDEIEAEDCGEDDYSDFYDTDNGPTGHGDMCWSDADPGL